MSQEISITIPVSLFTGMTVDEAVSSLNQLASNKEKIDRLEAQNAQLRGMLSGISGSIKLIGEEVHEWDQAKAYRDLAEDVAKAAKEL